MDRRNCYRNNTSSSGSLTLKAVFISANLTAFFNLSPRLQVKILQPVYQPDVFEWVTPSHITMTLRVQQRHAVQPPGRVHTPHT